MSDPGALNGRRTIEVRCLDRRGFVDYDDLEVFDRNGNAVILRIPVVFRWSCRNQKCCPRREGEVGVHRVTLYGVQNDRHVGEAFTQYEPMRPLSELIDSLPPERVRRLPPG